MGKPDPHCKVANKEGRKERVEAGRRKSALLIAILGRDTVSACAHGDRVVGHLDYGDEPTKKS